MCPRTAPDLKRTLKNTSRAVKNCHKDFRKVIGQEAGITRADRLIRAGGLVRSRKQLDCVRK